MNALIDNIQSFLASALGSKELVILVISILPIVEARLAVPMAFAYGMPFYEAFALAFLGSTVIAPLLLLVLMPLIRWLAKTKLFRRIGQALEDRFERKSEKIDKSKSERKKMLALFLFVAIPLPLTGVWTGCAVGSVIGLKYRNALISVVGGNFVASAIMTLLCALFPEYVIDWIVAVIGIIALIAIVIVLIKIFTYKPKNAAQTGENQPQNDCGTTVNNDQKESE